jgi:hypothetical protein
MKWKKRILKFFIKGNAFYNKKRPERKLGDLMVENEIILNSVERNVITNVLGKMVMKKHFYTNEIELYKILADKPQLNEDEIYRIIEWVIFSTVEERFSLVKQYLRKKKYWNKNKEKYNEIQKERYNNLTPEQKAARREKQRESERRRYAEKKAREGKAVRTYNRKEQ